MVDKESVAKPLSFATDSFFVNIVTKIDYDTYSTKMCFHKHDYRINYMSKI